MASSDDGDGGGDHNMSNERVYNFNVDFDGAGGQLARSSTLARSFSMSTEGEESLRNYGMALDLLEEQKREKDRQIEDLRQKNDDLKEEKAELKQEKCELKEELRESKAERVKMNQRIELLLSEKQDKDSQIDQLKQENHDLKDVVREFKARQMQMNQCIESLQSEKQALGRQCEDHEKKFVEKLHSEQSFHEQMKEEKEVLEKRCAALEAECQNEKSKFELESAQLRQDLCKKTTELDGMILALNDARQQNTDFQREAEQQKQELQERIAKLTAENEKVNQKLIEKEGLVEALPPKFQFEPGKYYMQCSATKYFLALQVKHLLLDNTQKLFPTFTGLIKLVQNQDGTAALYSSLNGKQLKVDNAGEIVTVSQDEKEAGEDSEDFEFIQAAGNESGQLIIRSIQTEKFVRVSESLRLCADVANTLDASKFVLKSSEVHLQMVERYLRPNLEYYLKDGKTCFIGIIKRSIDLGRYALVLTSEAFKVSLKLVYNSDKSLSFYSKSSGKWLRTSVWGVFLDQQNAEDASKFEPLLGPDESDGVVLRSVQCWENLCAGSGFSSSCVLTSGRAIKFNFLPVN